MTPAERSELVEELEASRTNVGCADWRDDHPRVVKISAADNPAATLVRLARGNPVNEARAAAARRAMRMRGGRGRLDLQHR